MKDYPLTTQELLPRCLYRFPEREVVSLMIGGKDESGQPTPRVHRTDLGSVARRATQLAGALKAAGIEVGDRVATLAVNSYYHLEAYLGIPSMGAVLHTLNIRLQVEQLVWMANDSGAKALLLDPMFLPMVPAFRAGCPNIKTIVVFAPQAPEGLLAYDQWIAEQPLEFDWPQLDENMGASLCYTSGTTGNPKGVLYSHRSVMLQAVVAAHRDMLDVCGTDVALPIVPMFHGNGWGMPFIAMLYGVKLVFMGVFNDGRNVATMIQNERVTFCAGVVTVMLMLLQELERAQQAGTPHDISSLKRALCGGTPVPLAMIREFQERYGVYMAQGWGMTETVATGSVSHPPVGVEINSEEGLGYRSRQGFSTLFSNLMLVDEDNNPIPSDGQTMGRLLIRGTLVLDGYFNIGETEQFLTIDGKKWLDTGDMATLSPSGEVQIQDRTKDVIKSGGEWISSTELEGLLVEHPQVLSAVVVAVPHEQWNERPLALVIPRGEAPTPDALREHLLGKVAKWWIPDDFVMVEELTIGSTGKYLKRVIRDQHRDHVWSEWSKQYAPRAGVRGTLEG